MSKPSKCALCGESIPLGEGVELTIRRHKRRYHWPCTPIFLEYLRGLSASLRREHLKTLAFTCERQKEIVKEVSARKARKSEHIYIKDGEVRYMVRWLSEHAYVYRRSFTGGKLQDEYICCLEDYLARFAGEKTLTQRIREIASDH